MAGTTITCTTRTSFSASTSCNRSLGNLKGQTGLQSLARKFEGTDRAQMKECFRKKSYVLNAFGILFISRRGFDDPNRRVSTKNHYLEQLRIARYGAQDG
jgi:hypothetical protein